MTRPSSGITPEIIDKIAALIRAGNYHGASAIAAGVKERTFEQWLAMGRAADLPPGPCPVCSADGKEKCRSTMSGAEKNHPHANRPRTAKPDDLYVRLVAEVEKAESENHVQLVIMWKKAAQEDWRAAKEMLARRHPEQWGERTKHELSGSVSVGVEQLDARLSALLSDDDPEDD